MKISKKRHIKDSAQYNFFFIAILFFKLKSKHKYSMTETIITLRNVIKFKVRA